MAGDLPGRVSADVLVVSSPAGIGPFAGLHGLDRSVTLVHRRDRFRTHAATVRRVREPGVRVLTHCAVEHLTGDALVAG